MLWGRTTHSKTRPNVGLCIENTDVVKVALLKSGTLALETGLLHNVFTVLETSVDYQVCADQNGAVTLTRGRSRA
jgi:hypothetical protein